MMLEFSIKDPKLVPLRSSGMNWEQTYRGQVLTLDGCKVRLYSTIIPSLPLGQRLWSTSATSSSCFILPMSQNDCPTPRNFFIPNILGHKTLGGKDNHFGTEGV